MTFYDYPVPDIMSSMDWERIRAHYERYFEASGRTQQEVADAGQLPEQSAIQKLLANRKRGPSVETFVKAIRGLGLDVSTFFAELEAQPPQIHREPSSPQAIALSIHDRLRHLEHMLAASAAAAAHGRSHELSSISNPSSVVHIATQIDECFKQLVTARFETFRVELERSADHVAASVDAHRGVDPPVPRAGARDRRRIRKSA
jgi:transcriptional regulator with XRE-family HTH domain